MKTYLHNILSFASILLLICACSTEQINDPLNGDLGNNYLSPFGENCEAYPSSDIDNIGGIYTKFIEFGPFIVFGGTHKISVKRGLDEVVSDYETNQLQVRDFTIVNDKLLVCAIKGIFEVDASGLITMVSDEACSSLDKKENDILFTSLVGVISAEMRALSNIKKLNLEDFSFEYFTDSTYTDLNIILGQVKTFGDRVYALATLDNDHQIVEFDRDGNFIKIYNQENDAGLLEVTHPTDISETELFVLNDELYYFSGGVPAYMLKLSDSSFELIDTWDYDEIGENELFRIFRRSYYNDLQVANDKLYVHTSEGLFTLSFDNNEISYELRRDPLLPSNNLVSTILLGEEVKYVLSNYQFITKIECL